jgi:Uma2 family endonuclease
MRYEDLLLLPDDGKRHEIIDGEHYVNPAPYLIHQILLVRLTLAIGNHLAAQGGGQLFVAPADVVFSPDDVVEPDLFFISNARRGIRTPKNVQGAPDLVIEILSEGNRRYDEVTKRDLYRRYGVTEYWIVDPELQLVKIHRGGEKIEVSEGSLTTPILPGLAIDLAELFREADEA